MKIIAKITYFLFILLMMIAVGITLGSSLDTEIISQSTTIFHKIVLGLFIGCGVFFMGIGSATLYIDIFGNKKK